MNLSIGRFWNCLLITAIAFGAVYEGYEHQWAALAWVVVAAIAAAEGEAWLSRCQREKRRVEFLRKELTDLRSERLR